MLFTILYYRRIGSRDGDNGDVKINNLGVFWSRVSVIDTFVKRRSPSSPSLPFDVA